MGVGAMVARLAPGLVIGRVCRRMIIRIIIAKPPRSQPEEADGEADGDEQHRHEHEGPQRRPIPPAPMGWEEERAGLVQYGIGERLGEGPGPKRRTAGRQHQAKVCRAHGHGRRQDRQAIRVDRGQDHRALDRVRHQFGRGPPAGATVGTVVQASVREGA